MALALRRKSLVTGTTDESPEIRPCPKQRSAQSYKSGTTTGSDQRRLTGPCFDFPQLGSARNPRSLPIPQPASAQKSNARRINSPRDFGTAVAHFVLRADNVGNRNRLARRPRGAAAQKACRKAAKEAEARRKGERETQARAAEKARRKVAKEAEARRLQQVRIAAHRNHLRYWASVRAAEADGRLKPAAARLVSGGRSESNRRKF
jgi:hypothetical protein